ncbi:MAG: TonB-dependent receptor [Candidatus Marinimicrobia bacterium]|nr:TonB-dependent receptor [Candidatus Neomarinimicrobiota bacterium]MBT3629779.1 TonB-dependent receptor [Candidatus Neomarinimicrobiota bacterium]MBT3825661.1 TonB-dependent receptor [Candidatus Neomarinimicrobiota bacterium]MBT4132503.1 TonB-dependent receptor [Candidatus Neomarinimicrobiota bacterium]MBT4296802.1 TonB-dependent receptor [Candidatus Neomarinimicrobiota bacterium]
MKKIFLILPLLLVFIPYSQALAAATGTLSGRIMDSETLETLPGVNIVIDGTRLGAAADANGYFVIKAVPVGEYRLHIRMVGYKVKILRQVRVAADQETELQIELEPISIEMGAVTVTRGKREGAGERLNPSQRELEPREILTLAGGGEDIFRSITTMPGVIARSDASAQFYVRGGTPDQNLIIVDDVPVFNPYRLKALGGPISMFNPDVVEYVELLPGGFSAQYGDKLSSVLIARNREGSRFENLGKVSMSLIDVRVLAEGPLPGSGEEGSWLLSGRRTYYDVLLDRLADVPTGTVFPNFKDIQAKVVYDLSPEQKIRINFSDSREEMILTELEIEGEGEDLNLFENEDFFTLSNNIDSRLASVGWMNAFSDVSLSNLTLSRFNDTWTMNFKAGDYHYSPVIDMRKMEIREDLTHILTPRHTIKTGLAISDLITDIGISMTMDSSSYYEQNPEDRRIDDGAILDRDIRLQNASSMTGMYIQDEWILIPPVLTILGGFRGDYSTYTQEWVYSPRLSATYNLNYQTSLHMGWGHYYQAPNFVSLFERFERSIEWNLFETINLRTEKSEHSLLGLEFRPSPEYVTKLEGYYKDLKNLVVQRDSTYSYIPDNSGAGFAYGAELFLQKRELPNSRLSGWFSYSYSVSKEKGEKPYFYYREFDQRHTLSLVGRINIYNNMFVDIQYGYGSGFPWTPPIYDSQGHVLRDAEGEIRFEEKNTARYPVYERLDLRMSMRGELFGDYKIELYLELINALSHENIYEYYWSEDYETRFTSYMLPLLPFFGARVNF